MDWSGLPPWPLIMDTKINAPNHSAAQIPRSRIISTNELQRCPNIVCNGAPLSFTPITTIARKTHSKNIVRRYIAGRVGTFPMRTFAAIKTPRYAFSPAIKSTISVCHGLAIILGGAGAASGRDLAAMKLVCPVLAPGMRAVSLFDAHHRTMVFPGGLQWHGIPRNCSKVLPIRDIQITSTLESIYRFTTKI